MKNYKKIVTGSLMAMLILSTPMASFAKENEKNDNNKREKTEFFNKLKLGGSWWNSSWFKNNSKKTTTTPKISNITVASTESNSATIKWNTNSRSNSIIWYSTTSPVDTSVSPNMKRGDRVSKHKFELKRLQPDTKYYVVVGAANMSGQTKSSEISFTTGTSTSEESTPVITKMTGPETVKVGEVASLTINANDPKNKSLTYDIDWGDGNTTTQSNFTSPITISHTYNAIGTYIAKFTVTNSDGAKTTRNIKIKVVSSSTTDTTAPVISKIENKISGSQVTISWNTNEPSKSELFYSTSTPVDVNNVSTPKIVNNSLTTKHSISIPNLTSSTLYHFIIKSLDTSNNVALSSETTFSTN